MGSKSWIGSCLPEDSPPACLLSQRTSCSISGTGLTQQTVGTKTPYQTLPVPHSQSGLPECPQLAPQCWSQLRCEKEENGMKAGSMSSSWVEDTWTPPCGPFYNTARDVAFWQRPATGTILQNTLYSEWNTNKTWITGGPCFHPGVGSIGWTPLSLKEAD